tara:strand:- start:127 stop:276 length:150 start_codon:yes stop_codon:yes gene_type:complete
MKSFVIKLIRNVVISKNETEVSKNIMLITLEKKKIVLGVVEQNRDTLGR